eukprot:TRINITY_DN1064_c0_g1_i2.p1 TRINITY_DN1064_c0_g1~~TRINITY_DN1064_c0_g1_i2.p1  ORF type:complete len:462 (-),score=181.43 TRINITY_DN1064_c0_g1_i2:51-1436(-)
MQPEWHKPTNGNDKGLKVKNSLSLKDGKMSFIPQEGNRVTWYICGPTTYDHSHLGHARTYISFDIIRRILENYFGYEVFSVMNITDVDDKIILKARKRYLLKQFKENNKTNSKELSEEVIKAWEKHIVGMNKKIEKVEKDENKKESEREAEVNLLKKKLKEAEEDKKKVTLLLEGGKVESLEEIFTVSEDALQDKLDSELGHTVVDNNIYRKLAAEFEEEYLEDMRDLNVQMPDVLTRVTEFIPEVISYVEKILENEFAYVSNGSVYFDTVKFSNHQNHHYGKLEPSSVGIDSKLEEGEVLEIVKSKKDKFFFEILTSCDTLRDKELVPLGIELEDDSGVLWKRVPTSELLRKKELNNLKGYEKRLNQVSKELQDFSEFQNPPKTIFEGKYKDYDEKGVPSINLDGKPVNEKTKKKLEGILSKYTKNYELWKSKIEKNPNLISQLKQEEKDLQNKINNLIN